MMTTYEGNMYDANRGHILTTCGLKYLLWNNIAPSHMDIDGI